MVSPSPPRFVIATTPAPTLRAMTAVDPSDNTGPKPTRRSVHLRAALDRCLKLAAPWEGIVYRSVTPKYARSADLLSGLGSRRVGGRWNPPGTMNAVYASLDPETAMREALSHYRYYRIPEHDAMPRVFVAIRIKLRRVLDLRPPEVRTTLRVSLDRMTRHDWRKAQEKQAESLTQALGLAAFELGLHALLVPAATGPGGGPGTSPVARPVAIESNVVVFPHNIRPDGVLEALRPWEPPDPT